MNIAPSVFNLQQKVVDIPHNSVPVQLVLQMPSSQLKKRFYLGLLVDDFSSWTAQVVVNFQKQNGIIFQSTFGIQDATRMVNNPTVNGFLPSQYWARSKRTGLTPPVSEQDLQPVLCGTDQLNFQFGYNNSVSHDTFLYFLALSPMEFPGEYDTVQAIATGNLITSVGVNGAGIAKLAIAVKSL